MADSDPFKTQRDTGVEAVTELSAVGFEDAEEIGRGGFGVVYRCTHAPSCASDVYGLGATLFCALTGHAAFERRSGEQVMSQFLRITNEPIPDLRESGMPEGVIAVIEAAMSRDPGNRPTAAALGAQLQRIQRDEGFEVEEMALRAEPDGEDKGMPIRGHGRLPDSASGETGNLPLELTSFVGRRTQVSEVKSLLAGGRLVTLTGIGGVGKTRLALQVADKLRRAFPDTVWLVELGERRDAALLTDIVGAALGLRSQPGRPMLEVLVEFFAGRELLLVLDNCEQVIEAVAELAESLLRVCPGLRILATSREALGIGGESVFPVSPLAFPDPEDELPVRSLARYDAVRLFVARAAAALPGFELTESNGLDAARICARLDGLPLAIELAAARLRAMSVQQILTRLDDRYALLTSGTRGAPTRQQTLRWCIGWSYELCTPAEKRLWGRLSVFAGGFDLDAAEQVCNGGMAEWELLDSLSGLVEKSILIRDEADGAVRFRMLGVVQDYGTDQLEQAGESEELSRRHRDWYQRMALDAAAQWLSPRQLEWIAQLERELPNLRKALEFSRSQADEGALRIAAALYCFWLLRGRLSEGRRWCERALSCCPAGPSVDRAKTFFASGMLAATQGDLSAATACVAELRVLADQTADPSSSGCLALLDGYTALVSGDLARANTVLSDAFEVFRQPGDPVVWLSALSTLAVVCNLQGDTAQAHAFAGKALEIAESHGDTMYRAYLLSISGSGAWLQGDLDQATNLLEQSVRLSRLVVDPVTAALCLESLAWIAVQNQDARRAVVLMGAAERLRKAVGSSSIFIYDLVAFHAEYDRRAREILGARAYEAARRMGMRMSFDDAVGFALGDRPRSTAPPNGASATLTKREREVADLVAEGLTNKAIAARLVISQRTAQHHVEKILIKLGFSSRAQIAAWAVAQPQRNLD